MPVSDAVFVITLECDEPGHQDATATATFSGKTREAALAVAEGIGWRVDAAGDARCPAHAATAPAEQAVLRDTLRVAARMRAVAGRLPSADRSEMLEEWAAKASSAIAHAFAGVAVEPAVHAAPALPGIGSLHIQVAGEAGRLLGTLWVLGLQRSSDWITPPGAGLDGFATEGEIWALRETIHGHEAEFAVGPRGLILASLAEIDGAEGVATWLRRRSLQWRIDDPDVWGAVFAPHTGRVWWSEGTRDGAAAGVRYGRLAMGHFARALAAHHAEQRAAREREKEQRRAAKRPGR